MNVTFLWRGEPKAGHQVGGIIVTAEGFFYRTHGPCVELEGCPDAVESPLTLKIVQQLSRMGTDEAEWRCPWAGFPVTEYRFAPTRDAYLAASEERKRVEERTLLRLAHDAPSQHRTYVLREYLGLRQSEIAHLTGTTRANISRSLGAARMHLAFRLAVPTPEGYDR